MKLLMVTQGDGRQGPCRDPERGRAEQGMDGWDGKTREAVGAARARERQSRADGRGHMGC